MLEPSKVIILHTYSTPKISYLLPYFRYFLPGGDDNVFYVEPLTGEITVARELDRTTDRYFLTVQATNVIRQTATCQVRLVNANNYDWYRYFFNDISTSLSIKFNIVVLLIIDVVKGVVSF